MGFENQPLWQAVLLVSGLAAGLCLRGRPANGLFTLPLAGLPFLGAGLTLWFC